MKQSILIIIFLCLFSFSAFAQIEPESDLVCISQADANECAKRALEAKALRDEVAELKEARKEDAKSIEELKKGMTELTMEASNAITRDAEKEKTIARLTAIIDFMLKNGRVKCKPFSICIGN